MNQNIEHQIIGLKAKLIELESDLTLLTKQANNSDLIYLAKKIDVEAEISVLKIEIMNLESLRIQSTGKPEHDSKHGRTANMHERSGGNSTHRQPELYASYNKRSVASGKKQQ